MVRLCSSKMMALESPGDELNRSDNYRNDPRSLHAKDESVVLHLLCEALDYVECPRDKSDYGPLRPIYST